MQVRVAMSAYACRGARHLLQDPNEKPWKADPKYFEKARLALLKKLELGQDVTCRMLKEEKQRLYLAPSSSSNAAFSRQPHLSTPTETASEMETVPTVLAVRVEVRACV